MKTILVPSDFSYVSLKALEVALSLASQLNARLLLCHVYRDVPIMLGPMFTLPVSEDRQEYLVRLKQQAKVARLDKQVMVPIRYLVRSGDTIRELLHVIEEKEVDLVVMGTQQGPSFLDKLFGSTTEQLLRLSPCPVLAVPENTRIRELRKIVYASDLEPDNKSVMQQLFRLKSLITAAITVLHVKTDTEATSGLKDDLKASLFDDFAGNDFSFVQVYNRHISAGIVKYAKKHHIDIIAFAEEHRNNWDSLRLASTSGMLLYALDVPVLAMPKQPGGLVSSSSSEKQDEVGKDFF
ncbi:universal stress protein [Pontibacter qinzhouensis]|uniref:Universal stress protein n=1 Tax=Pontibacter qinzhouensis TaxID=2603253 RepID=A0A5C8JGX2_9BACT|nr:universal stress protein [Pontibacter qinzhouensis]TXK36858.1 universal stress protein [Pontibacter qinzhouensis]